jgi:hypothetical protein
MWTENNQHFKATHASLDLLQQILPVPAQCLVTNRFITDEDSLATCKPGCSGQCEGKFA